MEESGVAIGRGKGIQTRMFLQHKHESRYDFIIRVMEAYKFNLDQRNTLTVEFVWDTYD